MNGNLETEEYAEGIYVGYRYFDSFGIEPLFSFGYGLSYTEFDIRLCGINTASKGVTVTVEVENNRNNIQLEKKLCRFMLLFLRMEAEKNSVVWSDMKRQKN